MTDPDRRESGPGVDNPNGYNHQNVSRTRLWIGIGALAFVLLSAGLGIISVYYVNEHSARIKFATESALSLLVLVVIVIQACIYYRQSLALDRQTKISDDTFRLLERPSLGIIGVELLPTEDKQGHCIRATYKNTGHLPARTVSVITSGAPGIVGTVEKCADLWPIEPPRGAGGILSKGSVPINSALVSFAYPPLTNAEFEPIENGKILLYVYSRADYGADGKTRPFFAEFYGRFNPLTGQFDTCDAHNDAN